MRRIFLLGLLSVLILPCFSQTDEAKKIENEYYGLKWGCSPSELKAKYPSAYFDSTNDDGDDVYRIEGTDASRLFFFENGKFYRGRIAYKDCSNEKKWALIKKLSDIYGKFNNITNGSEHGNEYTKYTINYSNKVEIDCDVVVTVKNAYGYNSSQLVMVTYENKEFGEQIARERIDTIQKDLEL